MRVTLATIGRRVNIWLRFGAPQRIVRQDAYRRVAVFQPGAVCCRVRWAANEYGTVMWQLMVMQAGLPGEGIQRVAGVSPGARILLRAEGERRIKAVLSAIDAIEAAGIPPVRVSTAYWRTVDNRLAARLALPAYTAERHAAHCARSALGA
ncbi:DUF2840 domain-containing protein [Pusillimonas noertemannii]|nr:DUF2840 domain-containing protein [Pusillimonas noertemannii]